MWNLFGQSWWCLERSLPLDKLARCDRRARAHICARAGLRIARAGVVIDQRLKAVVNL
ncbi:hypothetical protein KCP76_07800 [Salmonella enterica subsp. enterica serovar Weltevreden]|nr:hypothetical protein KCP76_07800 [Salmonella enterica subsp. enterica serovar Weltevreden]